mgnify:FL=1
MKNNRKKQTSSYLLIFLGIIAALLILIILYLTFFRKDSQSSINLAKNDSATDQTEDFTDGETFGFTSGDETSDDADQSGFVSDDGSSDSEVSTDDSSVQGPSRRESAGPVQSSPAPEEVTVPYQTPAANAEPVDPSQSSGSDSAQTTDGTSQEKEDSSKAAITPELSDDDGTISPSHGSSAFDNKSDEKMDTLVTQVQSQLPGANGSWSVYICDLAGGSEATINDSPMQAASLIKLFIMGAVYENYDSLSQQYGSATLDSYLTPMITVSDNDAANSLVSCLGGGDSTAGMQKVNSFCQSHGYTNTSMGRLLLASNEFGDNYTSAYDCGKFLKEIYQICSGTTQTPSLLHAEEMYSLLKQQQRTNKIPAALPEGVSVANKTGELSDVENDAGILYNAQGGNDLVIVFLSQNLSSPGEAQNTIAQLSRSIYLYYND